PSRTPVLPAPIRMTGPAAALDPASLEGLSQEALDERPRALANAPRPPLAPASLEGLSQEALDERLRAFANAHGAGALPALTGLAARASERGVRRAAKRALYRLSQRGVAPAPAPPPAHAGQRRAP